MGELDLCLDRVIRQPGLCLMKQQAEILHGGYGGISALVRHRIITGHTKVRPRGDSTKILSTVGEDYNEQTCLR